jgi:hypothetical protein
MSSSVTLPVDDHLDSEFRNASDSSTPARFFVVSIKDEKLVLTKDSAGSSDVGSDYDSLQAIAESDGVDGFYVLFRKGTSNKEWLFITYVPDTVSVRIDSKTLTRRVM